MIRSMLRSSDASKSIEMEVFEQPPISRAAIAPRCRGSDRSRRRTCAQQANRFNHVPQLPTLPGQA